MIDYTNWWKDFFSGLIVEFWRAAMTPEITRAETNFFEKRLELSAGARLLDVPCGEGRISLELARRGYRMTGVDFSEEFLAVARESAQREGLEIAWRRSDMRDLPWEKEFDGVLCAGSSFGFLGDEADRAFLGAVSRALRPGAPFVIDAVKAAEVVLPNFRERNVIELPDLTFVAENRYDHETGWMENRYTVSRGERREMREAAHRIYTYREVVRMLEEVGFSNCLGFGSLEGEPFRLGSPRLIVLARKRRQAGFSGA